MGNRGSRRVEQVSRGSAKEKWCDVIVLYCSGKQIAPPFVLSRNKVPGNLIVRQRTQGYFERVEIVQEETSEQWRGERWSVWKFGADS
jgi:hypothetical protein